MKGGKCLKQRDYDSSDLSFNEALSRRLMLFGANSELALQCHSRLMDLSCLQHDIKKAEYHLNDKGFVVLVPVRNDVSLHNGPHLGI